MEYIILFLMYIYYDELVRIPFANEHCLLKQEPSVIVKAQRTTKNLIYV